MAFTVGNKPAPGYPQPFGTKEMVEFDHTGPASYAAFTSPTTGGEVLAANGNGLNMSGFDRVSGGVDTTGQISVAVVPYLGGYGNAMPKVILVYTSLVTATLGGQAQTAGTQVVATTNLSTFSWRLEALCV